MTGHERDAAAGDDAGGELETLRRQRDWLWHQLNHTADAILVHDLDGNIVDVNQAACRVHRYDRQTFLGLNVDQIARPFDLETARTTWREVAAVEAATSFTGQHVRSDGTSFPVEVNLDHFNWGGRPLIVAVIRDLTERRRLEQGFRLMVEKSVDPVFVLQDELIVYANRAAAELLGYRHGKNLLGRTPYELVHPAEHERLRRDVAQLAGAIEPQAAAERTLVARDGTVVSLETTLVPMLFEGRPAVAGIGRDVSYRKRQTAERMQADRTAVAGNLAAGVAHEINNPLAYLVSNLDYSLDVLEEAARTLDAWGADDAQLRGRAQRLRGELAQAADALADARQGSARVRDIVRELGKYGSAPSDAAGAVDVREALEAAIQLSANQIRGEIEVVRTFEPVPEIVGHRARLVEVFVNLLHNAAQAIDGPGGQIRVGLRSDHGEVVAEIADNGHGIAPEHRDRVFEPFFSTRTVGQGTGLGLFVARAAIDAMGGAIAITRTGDDGTIVEVRLPSNAPAEAIEP